MFRIAAHVYALLAVLAARNTAGARHMLNSSLTQAVLVAPSAAALTCLPIVLALGVGTVAVAHFTPRLIGPVTAAALVAIIATLLLLEVST